MFVNAILLSFLIAISFTSIVFVIVDIFITKKKKPLKKSDIFDKQFETHWKNLAREVSKLNKNMAHNRRQAMPFKAVRFYVYIVLDKKLNVLGCYFEKEMAEYIADNKCGENENRFIQEIEVK